MPSSWAKESRITVASGSGIEASVVRKLPDSGKDMWTMAKWNFLG